ncbi:hypothetical protein B0H19DRAFT_708262 [Mycena capillaripes]|nr:hypothetical protein B0H19DRAFT_708262 [Mycena capillaripes]
MLYAPCLRRRSYCPLRAVWRRRTQSHQARQHSDLAQRIASNTSALGLEKRDAFSGVAMTWYPDDTGPNACTGKNHQDSDWYVAMYVPQYGDGSACCGKQLRINYNGKSAVATCVDSVRFLPSPSPKFHLCTLI